MNSLLVKGKSHQTSIVKVTPESAAWKYVGFEALQLKKNERYNVKTEEREFCVVLLSGFADVITQTQAFNNIGERTSVFDAASAYSVYVPYQDSIEIVANSDIEIALCSAPGGGNFETRLISPQDIDYQLRGESTNTRHIYNILPENHPAHSLLVVEVKTPAGNWSSYPPHKHDSDNIPTESYLEETYYHRLNPEQGFAFQRVYTDSRDIDETMAVENHDVVMVPRGYHPVGAPHGYDLYYLNVMAGPSRAWHFNNDKDHEWIMK